MKEYLWRFVVLLPLVALIVALPDVSYAWGPATHMNLASSVLHNLQVLPQPIQELLYSFRYDYIYGCISADIISGKKFVECVKHCHNWRVGMDVLKNARTDSQRAFAYGYLSHLAADVVAHNYFVPNQIIASFSTRTLQHTYWELRFDAYADKSVWDLARNVAREVHKDNDPLLKETLANTIFSFGTNKRIFNSMLMIGRIKRWHRAMDMISSRSQWVLTEEDVINYNKLSLDSILAFLIDGKKAVCCKADPVGRKSLQVAREIRKKLKDLKRTGKISPTDYPDIFETLRPRFMQATFEEFGHLDLRDII